MPAHSSPYLSLSIPRLDVLTAAVVEIAPAKALGTGVFDESGPVAGPGAGATPPVPPGRETSLRAHGSPIQTVLVGQANAYTSSSKES